MSCFYIDATLCNTMNSLGKRVEYCTVLLIVRMFIENETVLLCEDLHSEYLLCRRNHVYM